MIGQPKNSDGYKQTRLALQYEESNGTVKIETVKSIMRQVQLVDSLQVVPQVVEPIFVPQIEEVNMQDDVTPSEETVELKEEPEDSGEQPESTKLARLNLVLCAVRIVLGTEGKFVGSIKALAEAVESELKFELKLQAIEKFIPELRELKFVWMEGSRRNPVYRVDPNDNSEVTPSMMGEPEPESEPEREQVTESATEAEPIVSTLTIEETSVPEEFTAADEGYTSVKKFEPAIRKDEPKTLIEELLHVAKGVDAENGRLRNRNVELEDELSRLKVELRETKARLESYETPSPEVKEFLEAHDIKLD
jgi:hypothetical protein